MKIVLLAALLAAPVCAQTTVSPLSPSAAVDATARADAAAAKLKADAACSPMAIVPPSEAVGGSAGTPGSTNCRIVDAVQPRITRAGKCTLVAGGTCAGTWKGNGADYAFPAGTNVVVTYMVENTGTQPVICNLTAAPTITGYSIRCWQTQTTTLSLAIVTAGLTPPVTSAAAAGTVVNLTGLPAT